MTHLTGNAPTGTPTWLDLRIPDLGEAQRFYGALFGWEFEDFGSAAGHYNGCLLAGRTVAGMMRNPDPDASEFRWNLHFASDDCDETVKRATDAGGTVPMPPEEILDRGRMAVVADPVGARFGVWQGRENAGSETVNEPGSLVWSELVTAAPGPAGEFYAAVFGHRLEPMPAEAEIDYTVLVRPDGPTDRRDPGPPRRRLVVLAQLLRGRRRR